MLCENVLTNKSSIDSQMKTLPGNISLLNAPITGECSNIYEDLIPTREEMKSGLMNLEKNFNNTIAPESEWLDGSARSAYQQNQIEGYNSVEEYASVKFS